MLKWLGPISLMFLGLLLKDLHLSCTCYYPFWTLLCHLYFIFTGVSLPQIHMLLLNLFRSRDICHHWLFRNGLALLCKPLKVWKLYTTQWLHSINVHTPSPPLWIKEFPKSHIKCNLSSTILQTALCFFPQVSITHCYKIWWTSITRIEK